MNKNDFEQFSKKTSSKNLLGIEKYKSKNNIEEGMITGYKLEPECELSSSSHTCILEAINLIIEDYRKSFLGKSLVLSGKSIIAITCGDGKINNFSNFYSRKLNSMLTNNCQNSLK